MKKMAARSLSVLLCIIICLMPAVVQADGMEWSNLSPAALPEDHMVTGEGFTLNVSNNIPYVLTNISAVTKRNIIVYKGETGYWPTVGQAIPMAVGESFFSSDVYNGQVYIAYLSNGTGSSSPIVKKLDNASGSWSTVGDLSGIQLRDITSFDNIMIKVHNGIPYIVFISSQTTIKVMKYEGGTWVPVGQALTETGFYIDNVKLQFDGDIPYVAWKKLKYQYSFQQINIARYQNDQWKVLPNTGGNPIATVADTDLDFCFDNGNVYLAYQDNIYNRNPNTNYEQTYVAPNLATGALWNNIVIWKNNGTKWEKLPETNIRCYKGVYCCIEAKSGRLYAASNGGGVWGYESQTGKWTQLAPVSSSMWTIGLECEGDKLYIAYPAVSNKVAVRSFNLSQLSSIAPAAADTAAPAASTGTPAVSSGTAAGTGTQAQSSPEWDGVWSTKNGTMMLEQSGSSVWGIYGTNENNSYTFKGTASGSKLTGTFEDGSGKGTGTFEFTLNKNGSFTGKYKYNGGLDWITISGTK